jgi:hypothetical protein
MSVDVAERSAPTAGAERVAPLTERLQVAKHALARAEAATGMRAVMSQFRPLSESTSASRHQLVEPTPPAVAVSRATVGDRFLPVPDALAPLIPFGGLRRGSVTRVEGSASLLLGIAAAACREGAWCAVLGLPDLGLAAAAEIGLPLDRMALVPESGASTLAVLAAAVDGFDVIVVGNLPHLVDRDRRTLSSRLRHREAVLLSTEPWPGAELVLSVTESRWTGVGQGHGALRGRDLSVRVSGRGAAAGRVVRARLRSPDGVHLVPVSDAVPEPALCVAGQQAG